MKTPPSASASPETPSAVKRALADEFAELAAAATPGTWRDGWYGEEDGRTPRTREFILDAIRAMMEKGGPYFFEVAPVENAPFPDSVAIALTGNGPTSEANCAFIAWCGTHRAIIEAALRAVADSAEEAPR